MQRKRNRIVTLAIAVMALAPLVVPQEAGADHSLLRLISNLTDGAFDARFEGASLDGQRVFYNTAEQVLPADTDDSRDIYERFGDSIAIRSIGTGGGNGEFGAFFDAASVDGTHVFFDTQEALLSEDTDAQFDLYENFNGVVKLISTGPTGGNGPFNVVFHPPSRNRPVGSISADGTHVFFETAESLVAADTDAITDVYERFGGITTLVSTGPAGGNANVSSNFQIASTDGERVIFSTSESLVSTDTDTATDLYERFGDTTTLLTTGPAGGNANLSSTFEGASADATHLFFETDEALVSTDTDIRFDLYERFAGTTTHLSTGPAGGNGDTSFAFWENSTDGSRVFFSTSESLVTADTDQVSDIYERSGGQTTLISTGPAGGNGPFDSFSVSAISADGTHVFFETQESLVSADTDSNRDVYERSGGQTALISTGPAGGNGAFDAFLGFRGISADGTRAFFTTSEPLVVFDTDSSRDLYERTGGTTSILSVSTIAGNGSFDVILGDTFLLGDGTRVFYDTAESLLAGDTDSNQDVYAAEVHTRTSEVASSTVNLRFKRGKFSGRVRASSDDPDAANACKGARKIRVKKVRRGKDPIVRKAITGPAGKWRVGAPSGVEGRFYAKVLREVRSLVEFDVTCLGRRSKNKRI